jgi:NitT/TauT family transport system permease protein
LPGPIDVLSGIVELAHRGLLLRHVAASLFRVTWGFLAAVAVGVPLGLWLGLDPRAARVVSWLLQAGRMVSPLAWIPIAILWFGVGDPPALFIVFIGSVFPIVTGATHAVRRIDPVHVAAGRNFGLRGRALLSRVVLPAALPDLIVTLRLSLGIAWLVVVAAEMIAVSSGLGFLIVDARNSGNRYDLVVAGIVLIGAIGVLLSSMMKALDRSPAVAWARASTGSKP